MQYDVVFKIFLISNTRSNIWAEGRGSPYGNGKSYSDSVNILKSSISTFQRLLGSQRVAQMVHSWYVILGNNIKARAKLAVGIIAIFFLFSITLQQKQ